MLEKTSIPSASSPREDQMCRAQKPKPIRTWYVGLLLAMLFPLISTGESLNNLPQFESENSATVLGLEKKRSDLRKRGQDGSPTAAGAISSR